MLPGIQNPPMYARLCLPTEPPREVRPLWPRCRDVFRTPPLDTAHPVTPVPQQTMQTTAVRSPATTYNPRTSMALEPGSRLDAYEIVRPLGSGRHGRGVARHRGAPGPEGRTEGPACRSHPRPLPRPTLRAGGASRIGPQSPERLHASTRWARPATASTTSRWSTSRARRSGSGSPRHGCRSARRSTSRFRLLPR